MANQCNSAIKECRTLLEQVFSPAEDSQEIARTVFLRLAAVRCVEEQLWQIPSQLLPSVPLETLCQAIHTIETLLGELTGISPAWDEQWLFQLPASVFKTIQYYLIETISPEAWQSDQILGEIYQALLDETPEQKQHGRFYTPEPVVETIVRQALDLWGEEHDRADCTLLDLGCGAGNFALCAFDQFVAWYQQHGNCKEITGVHDVTGFRKPVTSQDIPRQILERHLFLVDNDPLACQLAALNLYLKAKRLNPETQIQRINVVCADALQRWEEQEHDAPDAIRRLFTRTYDLVVGNPPYTVINQLHASQEMIRLYKSYQSAAFKINTFPLFIERGIELLKPHGMLGMIVPNTLFTQMYFEPLRRHLLATTKILRILDTKRLFDHAFVENCILLLQPEPDAAIRSQQRVECVTAPFHATLKPLQVTGEIPHPAGKSAYIRQQHFEQAPFAMFRVHLTEAALDLIETITRDTIKLGDICDSHDGVNPGNAKQKLIVDEKLDDTCKPVLNGKNIGRYWLRWGGLYVRYDRRVLTKGDNVRWGDPSALNGAKILTRQTADRIIGTFEPGDYYTTNSIHTTVLKEGVHDFDLKYLLALLNSNVLSFYYRRLIPEAGQVFSQVKLINLRQLPIKQISWKMQQTMVTLVDQLLSFPVCGAATGKKGNHNSQTDPHLCRRRDIEDRLEALVYHVYALTTEQIQLVEREFAKGAGEKPKA